MSHQHFDGLRIIPDKPGPNHAEILKAQRNHKPHVYVKLVCESCDVVSAFEWTSKTDIETYKKGHLNCPKCGTLYSPPKVGRNTWYGGPPLRFKQYSSYPISSFFPKSRTTKKRSTKKRSTKNSEDYYRMENEGLHKIIIARDKRIAELEHKLAIKKNLDSDPENTGFRL